VLAVVVLTARTRYYDYVVSRRLGRKLVADEPLACSLAR
jgi:hypothetical protein